MDQTNSLLEEALRQLDSGQPLDRVLASLPPDNRELASLVQTAAAIRSLDHPQMNLLTAQAQRRRVLYSSQKARSNNPALKWPRLSISFGLAGVAILVVLLVLVFSVPANARAATLTNVQGVVEVASSPDADHWVVAAEGQRVRQGEVVRTRPDSSARLVYFEGSQTQLEPDSAVLIETLSGGWGRVLRLQLRQLYGQTDHRVVPFQSKGAFYRVETPAGMAEVHGTVFGVDVDPADGVFYSVDHGKVAVSQQGTTVFLTAGQATLVEPQSTPEDPTYAFYIQGPIESMEGESWVVGGTPVTVPSSLGEGFQSGDWVVIRGRILSDGTYLADRVTYARNEQVKLRFTGVIESIGESSWVIGGKTVLVNDQTELDGDLSVGDVVSVSYLIQPDGSWLAREIEALEGEDRPTPTPTPTVEESPTPQTSETPTATLEVTETLTTTPETSETPTATPEPTLEGNRAGCQNDTWQHPEGLRLASRWGVSYNEIMSWFCQGYGFGEIDLAYELAGQSGKPVAEVFSMRASGMGWGNIKQALEPQSTAQPPHGKPTPKPKPTKKKP